jgi:hypothetical protein
MGLNVMGSNPISPLIEKIWKVLEKIAGAMPCNKAEFVQYAQEVSESGYSFPAEFRFCGSLGFGGKLYFRALRKPSYHSMDEPIPYEEGLQGFRVDFYNEDWTPERAWVRHQCNVLLKELDHVR